jgi:hypothetical protein
VNKLQARFDEFSKTTAADMKKTDFKMQKDADAVKQQVRRRSIYQANISYPYQLTHLYYANRLTRR